MTSRSKTILLCFTSWQETVQYMMFIRTVWKRDRSALSKSSRDGQTAIAETFTSVEISVNLTDIACRTEA